MKLSMWILHDWLKPFSPTAVIDSGRPVLRNARHFSDEVQIERQNVYIGREQDFFPSGGKGIICAQNNDYIILDTDDYEAVFNSVLRAFDVYNSWSDELHEKTLAGCSIQDLVDDSESIFDDPLFIQDSTYHIPAYSLSYGPGSLDPDWDFIISDKSLPMDRIVGINNLIIPLMKSRESFFFQKGFFPYNSICHNIFQYNKHVGWLVLLENSQSISQGRMQLIDAFAHAVEFWLERNEDKKVMQANTSLFLDLLDNRPIGRDLVARALETLHWKVNDEFCAIKISCLDESSQELNLLTDPLERSLYGCSVVPVGLSLLIIANLSQRKLDDLLGELKPWMERTASHCGISYIFQDILLLRDHYDQAEIAISQSKKTPGNATQLADCALAYAISILGQNRADIICHPALDILRRYDQANSTNLFETLHTFLRFERNQVRTAEHLFLHRNSLAYRIGRIHNLTGLELDDTETRLHLLLSFSIQITVNG